MPVRQTGHEQALTSAGEDGAIPLEVIVTGLGTDGAPTRTTGVPSQSSAFIGYATSAPEPPCVQPSAASCARADAQTKIVRRSAQLCDLLALDEIEVDLGTDTRLSRAMGKAVFVDRNVVQEPVLVRAVRQEDFEVGRVADGASEVKLRHVVERVAAVMYLVVHVKSFCEVRGLEHGGQPAFDGNVTAQRVGRTLGEPDGVGADVTGGIFGGENRDVELLLEFHIGVDILLVERVLVPEETQALDDATNAHGVVIAVAPSRIEHQCEVVADRSARGLAHLDVLIRVLGRVDLVALPAVGLELNCFSRIGLRGIKDLARRVGADLRAPAP